MICGTCNVLRKPSKSDPHATTKQQGGFSSGSNKNTGRNGRDRKRLRCFQDWHPLEDCDNEECATCLSLSATQHTDKKCPIFKYALRYYLDHGELPCEQTFFPNYGVPETLFKLCFPGIKKYPSKDPDDCDDKETKRGVTATQPASISAPAPASDAAPARISPSQLPVSGSNPSHLPVSGAIHFLMRVDGRDVPCVMDS